tara:strand:- start:56 stop:811 length:756 start_codon:yes stop_codon:yes gene_type:complete
MKNTDTVTFTSADQYAAHLIAIDELTQSNKRLAFEGMVNHFGSDALLPKKLGGINTQAFKEGTTPEGQEAAATKAGLSKDQGIALCSVIKTINAVRPTMWQDYQIAYFGLETIKPQSVKTKPEPTAAQIRLEEIGSERREINADKTEVNKDLKIAKAEATLAKANGDADAANLAAFKVDTLELRRDDLKANSEELKDEADDLRTERKAGPLLDSTIVLMDKLNKAKVLLQNANDMTMGEIIDQLNTLAANS